MFAWCQSCLSSADKSIDFQHDLNDKYGGLNNPNSDFYQPNDDKDKSVSKIQHTKTLSQQELISLVKNFANTAIYGVKIQEYIPESNSFRDITYYVDRALQILTFEYDNDTSFIFPLSDVDVVGPNEPLNNKIVNILTAEELSRAVELTVPNVDLNKNNVGLPFRQIFLLEESKEKRERLQTCLRILRVYGQAAQQQGSKHQ